MRSAITQTVAIVICATIVGGCGQSWTAEDDSSEASNYFGITISDFVGARALPVQDDTVAAEKTDVSLPTDLLATAPEEANIALSAPDVAVDVDYGVGQVNPAIINQPRTVEVSFRLAPEGNDPCSDGVEIGPFEFTVVGDQISLSNESLPLSPEARAVTQNGRFEICAQAQADFDGTMALQKISLEFGTLKANESKVVICHIPPGNPDDRHTISVGSSAVDAHLAHGDYLGECLDPVIDLYLTPVCTDAPDTERRWRIDNANSNGIEVTWSVDAEQTGTLTATPDDSYFAAQTTSGDNLAQITWLDEGGTQQTASAQSTGTACAAAPSDQDSDGIYDISDACPSTPSGETVDSVGCSCSQIDTDGDGVDDCTDACPSTPAGDTPDTTGCACQQLDSDLDGVSNCDDLCPATTADSVVDAAGCATAVAHAGPDVTVSEITCVTLHGSANGGTEPYTYTWSAPGWEGSTLQEPSVVPTVTTTYTLTVTDWSIPPTSVTDTVTVTVDPTTGLLYNIQNLGSLSNNPSYPANINDAGDVVGYYYTDSWKKRAFLYTNGTMTDLGTLGGEEAYANDINNAGQIVGQAQDTDGNWRAYLWTATDGMTDLGTLGGSYSVANAINDAGQIVGNAATTTGEHAFLYSDGTMTDLGTTEYFQSGGLDINDDGQIVGTYLAWGYDQQAFVYDAGTFIDLGSPMLSGSRAIGINNDGLIAGYSWGVGEYRSFLYACGEVLDLGELDGFPKTYAWGLNNQGQIVGSVSTADSALSHAFVYTGGQLYDLNDLLATGNTWDYLTTAFAVNDNGQITGYGRINGQFRGFLLTPTN